MQSLVNAPSLTPGTTVVVQAGIFIGQTGSTRKRDASSVCTLTIYFGNQLIANITVTGGNAGTSTTIESVPVAFGYSVTMTSIETCPGNPIGVSMSDVVLALTPDNTITSSSTISGSSIQSPTTVSPSVTTSGSGASTSTASTNPISLESSAPTYSMVNSPSYIGSSTQSPSTSSTILGGQSLTQTTTYLAGSSTTAVAGTLTSTSPPTITTYSALPYISGACVRRNAASCTLSGAPVATAGLLASGCGVPPSSNGNYEPAYEQCARLCSSISGCQSWNLDRSTTAGATWTCNIYSGQVNTYAITYNGAYDSTVWFDSACFTCTPEELSLCSQSVGNSGSSSTTSSAASSTSSISSTMISQSTTTSPQSLITPPPSVVIMSAPAFTSGVCGAGKQGYYDCTLSGAPVVSIHFISSHFISVHHPDISNLRSSILESLKH